ncbi:MAG: LysE family translocator [Desulforegulaceae bacterium]|nr:LysE family translocator [Desulforegulaceae bacterium]
MIFNYSATHWAAFFSAAFLLNLCPGPDMAFILGQTAKGGVKSGFSAMFGIWTGALFHVSFAAMGLSAIIATSAIAFSSIKWIGAFYLIWIGIQAMTSKGETLQVKNEPHLKNLKKIFKQGMFVSILNPKVAIFFLAFLPQFVETGAGPASMQLFLHGFLIIVVAAFVEPPLVLAGGKLAGCLAANTKISKWMDKSLGLLFIWLGIKLASSDHI